jgi:hypothetical protein
MSLPELVRSLLGEESVTAEVSLGGEDALYVTPTRTLRYRADGLLSDESADQYGHDAERVAASEGRRKSKITLDYGLDGEEQFSVPVKRLDDALEPIVAGVLRSNGIVDADETVRRLFRFSELTVVVTDARVVKHIGAAVWDGEFEEFGFADVTDLDFEDGSVATSIVLTVGGRQERFKAPNEEARAVRETLKAAVLAYHDAPNLPALREATPPYDGTTGEDANGAASGGSVDFGDGPDPLSAEPAAEAEAEGAVEADAEPGRDADPEPAPASASPTSPNGAETTAKSGPEARAAADESGSGTASGSGSTAAVAETGTEATTASRSVGSGSDEPPGRSAGSVDSTAPGESVGSSVSSASAGSTGTRTESGSGPDAGAADESDGGDEFGDSGFRPAGPVNQGDVAAQLADLTEAVETQNEEIRRQRETFERLIEELRRGR